MGSTGTAIKVLAVIGALSSVACAPADDAFWDEDELWDEDDEFRSGGTRSGSDSTARPGQGGGGGWVSNSLDIPDVSGVQPYNPLSTPHGMAEDYGLLTTPEGKKTAQYLVECALPADRSISKMVDGEPEVFHGAIGLAPQWEDGVCDTTCQMWISACLLARTNVSQQEVDLWMQADHPAIGFGLPQGGEPMVFEAAFYGNLFWTGDFLYYCEGESSGMVASVREGRTCATGGCDFTNYGSCTNIAERCTMGGPDGDVPVDCHSEQPLYGPSWPTIATYLPAQ